MDDYRATQIVGPLCPGEYRDLPDGRYRVCCESCGTLLTVGSLVTLPPHGCASRQKRALT